MYRWSAPFRKLKPAWQLNDEIFAINEQKLEDELYRKPQKSAHSVSQNEKSYKPISDLLPRQCYR